MSFQTGTDRRGDLRLTRRQWREGDVALLEAAAARLGVQVPDAGGDDG